ncbi:MAG: hypothetical protein BWY45_03406 [Euryarchaeota archaeon ADurb.Bin294]|nr:MAG: hypothetical protein BWY45_03406 [Euryarchaeota archaeon ADurb.Bin294]
MKHPDLYRRRCRQALKPAHIQITICSHDGFETRNVTKRWILHNTTDPSVFGVKR